MCSISTRGAVGLLLEAAVAVAAAADAEAEPVTTAEVELAVHDQNEPIRRAATIMLAPEGVNLSQVPGGIGGATACVGVAVAVVAVVAGSEVAMMCAAVLLCTRCFLRAEYENPHQKDPVTSQTTSF